MAEGMVGWIQLLGEQYCFAVIVCSSTCSGFPGLGPLASYPMSRYTMIFCLFAITPTTTRTEMRTRIRIRTKTRTRMMTSMVKTAVCLVGVSIHKSHLRPLLIKRRMHWTSYVSWFLTLFHRELNDNSSARATYWDSWRRWWNVASGAYSIPTCPGTAP